MFGKAKVDPTNAATTTIKLNFIVLKGKQYRNEKRYKTQANSSGIVCVLYCDQQTQSFLQPGQSKPIFVATCHHSARLQVQFTLIVHGLHKRASL